MRLGRFALDQPLTAAHEPPDAWESVLPLIGPGHRIRGMFVAPIAAMLPAETRNALLPKLDEPPRGGSFVPFLSYSRRDYLRIVLAAADVGDAALTRGERIRQIASRDFETFSDSVLGRTVRAVVGTTRAAILKTPEVYQAVAPANDGVVRGGVLGDGRLELVYERYPIFWPYHLGQLEGMARSFADRCEIDVDVDVNVVRYLVRLL